MKTFNILNRKIKTISKYESGPFGNLKISGLFTTDAGKKYGQQLEEISSFVFACCFLTLPVGKIQDGWVTLFRTGRIEQLRPLADKNQDFDTFLEILTLFSHIQDSQDSTDYSRVFGKKEIRRFLALLTLSSYAYLDAYSKEIIESIRDSPPLKKRFHLHLETNNIVDNRCKKPVRNLKQVKNLSLNQRLSILSEELGVQKACSGWFAPNDYERYQKLLIYFFRLRGKMAHNNPEPSLKEFDDIFFERAEEEILGWVEDELAKAKIPEPLTGLVEIIISWFRKLSPTLAVVYSVPRIATVYPALIDATTFDAMV